MKDYKIKRKYVESLLNYNHIYADDYSSDEDVSNAMKLNLDAKNDVSDIDDFDIAELTENVYMDMITSAIRNASEDITTVLDKAAKYNMTCKRIGELLGIPIHTLTKWQRGERRCPKYVAKMIDATIQIENQILKCRL